MTDLKRIWEHVERHMARLLPKREEAPHTTSSIYSSIYQLLQHGEIRIVTLTPGKWKERLECSLKTVSLDDDPSYETLSYVWGDASIKKPLFLEKHRFQVTQSLESALRHLRHKDSERTMWIDALCINQNDDAEKTVQVKQMQFIYARTSHLVIWVGEESEDSDLGMRTLGQVGEELKEGRHCDVDLANVSLIKNSSQENGNFDPKPWVAANTLVSTRLVRKSLGHPRDLHARCADVLRLRKTIRPLGSCLSSISSYPTISLGTRANPRSQEYVDTLLREMQDETLSMVSREELKKLCEMVIDAKKTPQKPQKESAKDPYSFGRRREEPEIKGLSRVSDSELAFVGRAALRLDSPDLLEEVARVALAMLPVDLFQDLGKGLIERDIGLWQNGLKTAISRILGIPERVKAVDLLFSSYREAAGETVAATQNMQDLERQFSMIITET